MEKADRTCQRDGFPLVKIKGHWECVAEYLDRCIGGQCVVDVVQRGASYYFVFENGHELPLLCFCCGMPLLVEDLGKVRRTMGGRRLEAMSVGLVTLEDNSEMLQFRLEFSSKGLLGRQPPYEPISIQAAAQMRHPDDCRYGGGQPAKSRPRPKQRRKR